MLNIHDDTPLNIRHSFSALPSRVILNSFDLYIETVRTEIQLRRKISYDEILSRFSDITAF